MPDWNHKGYSGIKHLITDYTEALNSKNLSEIGSLYSDEAVMHRGMENFTTKKAIADWYETNLNDLKFTIKDATTGIFPDGKGICLIYYLIDNRQILIECLEVSQHNNHWKIDKSFALGYQEDGF